MKTMLISGGKGNFASQIIKFNTEYQIHAPSRLEMDITDYDKVAKWIEQINPDIFLHAAAFTRPMNKHERYPVESINTNIVGTSNIAMACIHYGVKLVYISTDYVYPGTTGNYEETDSVSPYLGNNDGVTKYGWSKLGGECAVRLHNNSLIIRACMCNYPFPHQRAATDIRKSLMFDYEAAPLVLNLLDETGIINLGGKSQSVYDFVSSYQPDIGTITTEEIEDVKIAPDTTMNTEKMKKLLGGK
tara:strand:- start:4982 stop:5716 length:735 start_codon:yes stop_codon:yes gene_type:complete